MRAKPVVSLRLTAGDLMRCFQHLNTLDGLAYSFVFQVGNLRRSWLWMQALFFGKNQ